MREVDVVRRIQKQAAAGFRQSSILHGVGDDCAAVRSVPGSDMVFTTDFLIEGRHFTQRTHKPAAVGHKALARSLSDLAAMGAEPLFCLVSLAIPAPLASRWLQSFYTGLLRLAQAHRITLAGGDLSKADTVVVDVMCCGTVPKGKALLRSGASVGDRIFVTGPLGGAAASGWKMAPQPRIDAGLQLRGKATAAMDLSDGLSLDLQRLCAASGVSADIHSASVPVAAGATLAQALHGGEDYELLFTAKPSTRLGGMDSVAIGNVTAGKPGLIRLDGKRLRPAGFDHFR